MRSLSWTGSLVLTLTVVLTMPASAVRADQDQSPASDVKLGILSRVLDRATRGPLPDSCTQILAQFTIVTSTQEHGAIQTTCRYSPDKDFDTFVTISRSDWESGLSISVTDFSIAAETKLSSQAARELFVSHGFDEYPNVDSGDKQAFRYTGGPCTGYVVFRRRYLVSASFQCRTYSIP